jgi:hypothetical protein
MKRTIEVDYRPGDRVHVPAWEQPATVGAVIMQADGSVCYLARGDTIRPYMTGWLSAQEMEPLVVDGQEVTP